jgi:hypothetical protein
MSLVAEKEAALDSCVATEAPLGWAFFKPSAKPIENARGIWYD